MGGIHRNFHIGLSNPQKMSTSYSQGHICQCLSRLATFRRDSTVTISGDRRKTGKQFVEEVLSLARGLFELGLKPGDVVAICALNSDWYLEWLLAVSFVGGIATPLNYRWSFEESRTALEVVKPVMLVSDESCNYWHSKINISSLRWHIFIGSPPDFKSKGEVRPVLTMDMLRKPSLLSTSFNYFWAPEGAAMICFTSGTTGRPKGVTLSHSALIVQSLAKVAIVGYGEDDVYLHTAPLCHIGGISSAMAMLMVGGCHVLMAKFEAKSALDAIEEHHVTSLISVPAIMSDLISSIRMRETWKGKDRVKKILNGAGGLSSELINNATKLFPRAKLLSAYGMTETCSSLTFMTLHDPTLKESSQLLQKSSKPKFNSVLRPEGVCIGKPAPHVELRICTEGSSHAGRILTRGPHVMLGYWDQIPGKEFNTSDGVWLDTGDIGSIDDSGNLWLLGRTNGQIKSGGENIYPEEVEAVLIQHPGISAIVAVGVPDARLTEKVVACIQIRHNYRWDDICSEFTARDEELVLSGEMLQKFCRENNLTGFKIPKVFILWRKQFPVTTSGKLQRAQIQRETISHLQPLPSNL